MWRYWIKFERLGKDALKIKTMGLMGIDGYVVIVETDISNGIPSFDMVGLGDTAVRNQKTGAGGYKKCRF